MNTSLATPEEPRDRCAECTAPFQFHIDNPWGVNYIDPSKVKFIFEPDVAEAPWRIDHQIRTCYSYKEGMQ